MGGWRKHSLQLAGWPIDCVFFVPVWGKAGPKKGAQRCTLLWCICVMLLQTAYANRSPRMMVWSRLGPTATILMGTPVSSSMRFT